MQSWKNSRSKNESPRNLGIENPLRNPIVGAFRTVPYRVPGVTANDNSEREMIDDIEGQARALRAFAHFQLLAFFSPDISDDSSLGVIGITAPTNPTETYLRMTTGEVFEIIESDLNEALNLISDSNTDPVFFSKDAVNALNARIAAYRQDYTKADQLAAQVLQKHPLAERADYANIWLNESNAEVIFKLERTPNDPYNSQGQRGTAIAGGRIGNLYAFENATIDGFPFFEISRTLFNLMDPEDVRYSSFLDSSSLVNPSYPNIDQQAYDTTDVLVISKYPGSEGFSLLNDLKVFRASEMLLIRAEAAAATGDLAGAAAFVQELRDARFGTPQTAPWYASQQEAFADILDERRVELAFEGHRLIDLKRLGARANKTTIDRADLDCQNFINSPCNLARIRF